MIAADITDTEILGHLDSIAADGMDIFLLNGADYRGAMLHGTRMVNQMRANHDLGILESLMLGHSYIAVGLLTALVKGKDRILVGVECDGPVGGIYVECSAAGEVRGHLRNTPIPVDAPVENFNLAPYIGHGTLSVTRSMEKARRPFTGHVELVHGNLAKDLAHYFVASEQTPTAMSLSIQFDRDGRITGAGGLFLQALPGADLSRAADLEATVRELPSLGALFAGGDTPAHLINTQLAAFYPEIIGTRTIEFTCSCSRERYAAYLSTLPPDERADIRANGPFPLKVTCHNCNTTYAYGWAEIEALAAGRPAAAGGPAAPG